MCLNFNYLLESVGCNMTIYFKQGDFLVCNYAHKVT